MLNLVENEKALVWDSGERKQFDASWSHGRITHHDLLDGLQADKIDRVETWYE